MPALRLSLFLAGVTAVPSVGRAGRALKTRHALADTCKDMIISEEQVRLAVEYLRTSDEYPDTAIHSVAVSDELLARISLAMLEIPDVRVDRLAEARERCVATSPSSEEIAAKLIGRVLSDSIR